MKKLFYFLLGLPALLIFTGCPNSHGYRYDTGVLPLDPVNFEVLNSPYDDYNMSSPVIGYTRYLYYSSNRNSAGAEFDIIGKYVNIQWSKSDGVLEVNDHNDFSWDKWYVDTLFEMINTTYNELGPYSLPSISYVERGFNFSDLVVYSSDGGGNLDLKMVSYSGEGEQPELNTGTFSGPVDIATLNSPSDDAYLCFYGPGFINYSYGTDPEKITEVYLCSDRGGSFDIYTVDVPEGAEIYDFLVSEDAKTLKLANELNTDDQDKCPFIDGDLLVFTSDRPGGFGGFDLYYSRRNGDGWTLPENFGSKINTEYDEYRPIVMVMYEYAQDLMLFSSNRPGGKGGYDLYYVGIPKMID